MTTEERLIMDKGYWIEYQERIAIMTIDGNVPEEVAKVRAMNEIADKYNLE